MEHVTKLLKGRKAAAKLELSYCEEGNEHYDTAREKLTEEIKQLDKSLLILSNVVWQGEPLNCTFELGVENCGFKAKDVFTCKHIRKCDMCAN